MGITSRTNVGHAKMADSTGFEPAISSVTGRRVDRATLRVHVFVPTAGFEPATIAL